MIGDVLHVCPVDEMLPVVLCPVRRCFQVNLAVGFLISLVYLNCLSSTLGTLLDIVLYFEI